MAVPQRADLDFLNAGRPTNVLNPVAAQDLVTRQYMEDNVPLSTVINDIVTISQAAYDALGPGRPTARLYLITS